VDTKPGYRPVEIAKIVKKAKTLPEVVEDMGKIAAEWGGVTESIRRLDKEGRIREMEVTIKFKAV
jgi:hypothetical protein